MRRHRSIDASKIDPKSAYAGDATRVEISSRLAARQVQARARIASLHAQRQRRALRAPSVDSVSVGSKRGRTAIGPTETARARCASAGRYAVRQLSAARDMAVDSTCIPPAAPAVAATGRLTVAQRPVIAMAHAALQLHAQGSITYEDDAPPGDMAVDSPCVPPADAVGCAAAADAVQAAPAAATARLSVAQRAAIAMVHAAVQLHAQGCITVNHDAPRPHATQQLIVPPDHARICMPALRTLYQPPVVVHRGGSSTGKSSASDMLVDSAEETATDLLAGLSSCALVDSTEETATGLLPAPHMALRSSHRIPAHYAADADDVKPERHNLTSTVRTHLAARQAAHTAAAGARDMPSLNMEQAPTAAQLQGHDVDSTGVKALLLLHQPAGQACYPALRALPLLNPSTPLATPDLAQLVAALDAAVITPAAKARIVAAARQKVDPAVCYCLVPYAVRDAATHRARSWKHWQCVQLLALCYNGQQLTPTSTGDWAVALPS